MIVKLHLPFFYTNFEIWVWNSVFSHNLIRRCYHHLWERKGRGYYSCTYPHNFHWLRRFPVNLNWSLASNRNNHVSSFESAKGHQKRWHIVNYFCLYNSMAIIIQNVQPFKFSAKNNITYRIGIMLLYDCHCAYRVFLVNAIWKRFLYQLSLFFNRSRTNEIFSTFRYYFLIQVHKLRG